MMIVEVIGGLGNQMFQYAAGRALATRLHESLSLDISGFDGYKLHNGFELMRIFSGQFDVASNGEIREVLGFRGIDLFKKILSNSRFSKLRGRKFIVEPHFQYWNELENALPNSYLIGYWQSEKYFNSIESSIRADFSFKLPMSTENELIAAEIQKQASISLHVRRGDYIQNTQTLATHGVCSLDYYIDAVKYVTDRINKPKFFIFSDDIQWVKENLKIDFPCCYIDHNKGSESYNDMRLMSMCQHHIIANSSFSWWGAWLNPNQKKLVLAPKKWFATSANSTIDLISPNWIVI